MTVKDNNKSPMDTRSTHNKNGEEICDPRPLSLPIGFVRPKVPLADEIRMLISQGVQNELKERGIESFDEADSFDVPEDDMSSPWEDNYDSAHLWTRDAEIRAGIVEHPTEDQLALAREIVARAQDKPVVPVAPVAKPPEAANGDKHSSTP